MTRPFRELADATGTPESRRIANERTLELLADEVARLRLTDEEREAISFFAAIHNEGYGLFETHTDTLRNLLERLK
jgi:hypothetical protein